MKEKFIKSTIVLVIGGVITKLFSMVIRIITTRIIGADGMGLYMMIMPSFNLFITIASLSFPLAISKLVSEGNRNNKNIIFGIIPVALIINLILIFIIVLFAPYIANNLLKNSNLYYPILATSITLPFICLSGIIRGYFFGRQRMIPGVVSNIVEQIVRIISIVFIIPYALRFNMNCAVTFLVLTNILSEFSSILVFLFFLPKKIVIKKEDLIPNIKNIKNTLEISIPTTFGRIISSIGLFFEPVILTSTFLKLGYSMSFITYEYGVINGYVLPIVTLPSFLSSAISNALLPVISYKYQKNDIKFIKKRVFQAILYSLLIGLPCTIIILVFPDFVLKFMFGEVIGKNYLLLASIIFLITYVNGPIISSLQAINKSNKVLMSNFISVITKVIFLIVLIPLNIKMYSLLFSYLFSFIIVTIYEIIALKKALKIN